MGTRNDSDATHIKWPTHRFAWVNKNSFECLWRIFRHGGKAHNAQRLYECQQSSDWEHGRENDGEKNERPTAARTEQKNEINVSGLVFPFRVTCTTQKIWLFIFGFCLVQTSTPAARTLIANVVRWWDEARSSAEKWLRSAGVGLFVPRKNMQ